MSAIAVFSEAMALACSDQPERVSLKSIKRLCGKDKDMFRLARKEYLHARRGLLSVPQGERAERMANGFMPSAYKSYLKAKAAEERAERALDMETRLKAGQVFFLCDDGKFRVKKGYLRYLLDCDKERAKEIAKGMDEADACFGILKMKQCYAKDVNDKFRADGLPALMAVSDAENASGIARSYDTLLKFERAVYGKCPSRALGASIAKANSRLRVWKARDNEDIARWRLRH